MIDLGPAEKFLRIQLVRHCAERVLNLSQAYYTEKILERMKMSDPKPVETLLVLSDGDKTEEKDNEVPFSTLYCSITGSIMYFMILLRPNIIFTVIKRSQHCEIPQSRYWKALK